MKIEYMINIKKNWHQETNVKNSFKVMFIFIIQMFMMILLFHTEFLEPLQKRDNEKEDHPFMLLAIKVLCSIMLHLSLQPQVNFSLERMQYLIRHPENFEEFAMPFCICFMKFLVEICQEFVCLAIVSTTNGLKDVVMDYIALGVISELDEIYFMSIRQPLKDQMQKDEYELPVTCNKDPKIISREWDKKDSPYSFCDKLLILFFNIMMCFYRIIYFHSF